MDDASKLYIANAGPILGGGFEVGGGPNIKLWGLNVMAGWMAASSFLHPFWMIMLIWPAVLLLSFPSHPLGQV